MRVNVMWEIIGFVAIFGILCVMSIWCIAAIVFVSHLSGNPKEIIFFVIIACLLLTGLYYTWTLKPFVIILGGT